MNFAQENGGKKIKSGHHLDHLTTSSWEEKKYQSLHTWRNYPVVFLTLFQFLFTRLTESSGIIHDGIGNYSIGVKCSWLIDPKDKNSTSGRNRVIRLHFSEFATECSWDHLYIFDGDSVQSPLLAVFR